LTVEVSIFETGVEPQLRVYFYEDDAPLDPAKASLELSLLRLASKPERFTFKPKGDFLLGDHTVAEPHSFAVEVKASWGTHSLTERYDSFEARVTMKPDVAAANGVASEPARARSLERTRRLTGRIGMASDRRAELRPRFAGVVRQATGRIGEKVAAGSTLAVLENSTTLSQFRIDSPISGVLLDRRAVVGSSAGTDDMLYVVADLSEVWADFDLYGADSAVVHPGETVTIRDDAGHASADAKIAYVSPLRDVHTQTTLARAILPNADGRWAPGSFVTGTIAIDEPDAAVAVPQSALQTWKGRDAVFVHAGNAWEVRPVLIGRRSEVWLEVLEGIDAGAQVATGNTFVLRAEIEKAGASHDH